MKKPVRGWSIPLSSMVVALIGSVSVSRVSSDSGPTRCASASGIHAPVTAADDALATFVRGHLAAEHPVAGHLEPGFAGPLQAGGDCFSSNCHLPPAEAATTHGSGETANDTFERSSQLSTALPILRTRVAGL